VAGTAGHTATGELTQPAFAFLDLGLAIDVPWNARAATGILDDHRPLASEMDQLSGVQTMT
jgi:hypothetical protein